MSAAGYQIWRERSARVALQKLTETRPLPGDRDIKEGKSKFVLEFITHAQERLLAEFNFVVDRVDVMYIHTYSTYDAMRLHAIADARVFYKSLVRAGFIPAIAEAEDEEVAEE